MASFFRTSFDVGDLELFFKSNAGGGVLRYQKKTKNNLGLMFAGDCVKGLSLFFFGGVWDRSRFVYRKRWVFLVVSLSEGYFGISLFLAVFFRWGDDRNVD